MIVTHSGPLKVQVGHGVLQVADHQVLSNVGSASTLVDLTHMHRASKRYLSV
jgi:hypothetical protein